MHRGGPELSEGSVPDERPVAELEDEIRRFWAARSLPPADGVLGRGNGPLLRQLIGSYVRGDAGVFVVHRAVLADIEARARLLSGDRTFGTLCRAGWPAEAPDAVVAPGARATARW